MDSSATAQINEQDSLALVALYNTTDGDNWTNNTNWLSGPVSSWQGISIQNERVTGIELQFNQLIGTIPGELGNLTELKVLNLALNQLTGPIPTSFENLGVLEVLLLSKNELSGLVPEELGMLSSLQELVLFDNQLEGPLPDLSALQNLRELVLGQNDFAGPFPEWVLDMPELTFVDFRRVGLTGNLPANLLESLPNLDHLRLDHNQLEGDISIWFHGTTPMQSLEIYNNGFSGIMQDSVVDVNIRTFSVGKNGIESIPDFSEASEMKSYFGIDQNRLGFQELEKAVNVTAFNPANILLGPQNALLAEESLLVKEGESFIISSGSSSAQDSYQWFKDGIEISGATSRDYEIPQYTSSDAGVYHCEISNSQFEFDLQRNPVTLETDGTTSIEKLEKSSISIFPNPTQNWITIRGKDEIQSVMIFDLYGRKRLESNRAAFDLSALEPGVFVARIESSKGFVVKSLIKSE